MRQVPQAAHGCGALIRRPPCLSSSFPPWTEERRGGQRGRGRVAPAELEHWQVGGAEAGASLGRGGAWHATSGSGELGLVPIHKEGSLQPQAA